MPFTISHAAAVLPLRRFTRLPLAALMIGSMSPDFAYFMPALPGRLATHNIAGLFWFCWPTSLALWLLYVRVLEAPTLALLPERCRSRITPSNRSMGPAALAWASLATILGAATHIAWDSFTHSSTHVSNAIPLLQEVAFGIAGQEIYGYQLLQHLSTVFGLVVLATWAKKLLEPGAEPVKVRPQQVSALSDQVRIFAVVTVLATTCIVALSAYVSHAEASLERRLFHVAIGGMTGWALAWCAVAVFVTRLLRTQKRRVKAGSLHPSYPD